MDRARIWFSLRTTRHSVDFRCAGMSSFRAQEPVREAGSKKLVQSGQETLESILGREEADRRNAKNSKEAQGGEAPAAMLRPLPRSQDEFVST